MAGFIKKKYKKKSNSIQFLSISPIPNFNVSFMYQPGTDGMNHLSYANFYETFKPQIHYSWNLFILPSVYIKLRSVKINFRSVKIKMLPRIFQLGVREISIPATPFTICDKISNHWDRSAILDRKTWRHTGQNYLPNHTRRTQLATAKVSVILTPTDRAPGRYEIIKYPYYMSAQM